MTIAVRSQQRSECHADKDVTSTRDPTPPIALMTIPTEEEMKISLQCYRNGRKLILTLREAVIQYYASNHAWARIPDYYRWSVKGESSSARVCESVPPSAKRFGLWLHCRGTRSLTINDLENLEGAEMTDSVFKKRASEFNKIFGELPQKCRPFFHYREGAFGCVPVQAYRMRSSRTWLVVYGVAPGHGWTDDDVDWSLFEHSSLPAEALAAFMESGHCPTSPPGAESGEDDSGSESPPDDGECED